VSSSNSNSYWWYISSGARWRKPHRMASHDEDTNWVCFLFHGSKKKSKALPDSPYELNQWEVRRGWSSVSDSVPELRGGAMWLPAGSRWNFRWLPYFHKPRNPQAFHEETITKNSANCFIYCLRLIISCSLGSRGRVPFLDKEFMDVAMRLEFKRIKWHPEGKMENGFS